MTIKVSQWDFYERRWDAPTQYERSVFVQGLMQTKGYDLLSVDKQWLVGWVLLFKLQESSPRNDAG